MGPAAPGLLPQGFLIGSMSPLGQNYCAFFLINRAIYQVVIFTSRNFVQ
ncbi:hypothetical protein SAMN05216348_10266 [Olsenella sp. KH3B4]|nr:hypothetical protein SAMN05216348_10266 [Olsenella sp. KH3B4]